MSSFEILILRWLGGLKNTFIFFNILVSIPTEDDMEMMNIAFNLDQIPPCERKEQNLKLVFSII